MQKLITANQQRIAELCRQHYVRQLYVFGSALREDFDPERSDIDLRVEFGEVPDGEYAHNYFALLDELRALFGRKIDLLSSASIRNPYLRQEIESTQETVYAA
jgi:uncharacterized protein